MFFGKSNRAKSHAASKRIISAAWSIAANLTIAIAPALAQTMAATPEARLISDPRSFIGKAVRVEGIYCVDPGSRGGFKCLKQIGAQLLLVDGSVMGARTPQSIAELLIGDCKGTANLGSSQCLMAIEFEPTAAIKEMVETGNGSRQQVTVHTGQLEFFRHTKRP